MSDDPIEQWEPVVERRLLDDMRRRAESAEAALREAREVLAPLAEWLTWFERDWPATRRPRDSFTLNVADTDDREKPARLTVGMLRRIRAALKPAEAGEASDAAAE